MLTKFAPVPPTPENKGTWVPSGAIRTAVRSESGENAAVSETVMSAIVNVPSKLGTVNVELESSSRRLDRSGRSGRLTGSTAGPAIEPAGPMIDGRQPGEGTGCRRLAGRAVLTCIGRSNVTLSVLVVPSVIRLP